LALGRIALPEARTILMKAADEQHPLIRNAVNKALEAPRRYR
jgi:hypothetical protein